MAAIKKIMITALICLMAFPLGYVSAEDYLQFSTYYYDIKPDLAITKPTFTISKDLSMNTNALVRVTVDDVRVNGITGATKAQVHHQGHLQTEGKSLLPG